MNENRTFKTDSEKTIELFPFIKPYLIEELSGEIILLENQINNPLAMLMDRSSGIDALQIEDKKRLRGLALRNQDSKYSFNSFTIRYSRKSNTKTEYEKRKETLEEFKNKGFLYPYYTIQAYIDYNTHKVSSIGIVETEFLYKYIDENLDNILSKQKKEAPDGNTFIYVTFKELLNFNKDKIILIDKNRIKEIDEKLEIENVNNFFKDI